MTRLKLALLAFLAALVLSGCELPSSVEELTHWSELFFLNPEPGGTVQSMVLGMSNVLVGAATLVATVGLAHNMIMGSRMIGGLYITGLVLMSVAYVLRIYIPLASDLGKLALGDLTIDQVMQTYDWGMSLNPVKIALQGTAISLTIALPRIVAMYEIYMTILLIIALWGSVVGSNTTAAVFSASQLLGWVLFLWLYRFLIVASGLVTSIPFAGSITVPVMNGLYIGGVIGLLIVCLWGLPGFATRRIVPLLQVVLYGGTAKISSQPKQQPQSKHRVSRNQSYTRRVATRTAEVTGTAIAVAEEQHKVSRRNS